MRVCVMCVQQSAQTEYQSNAKLIKFLKFHLYIEMPQYWCTDNNTDIRNQPSGDLTALKFSPQTTPPPPPPMTHGFLIPAPNSTQTLNRHLQYQFNQALPMQSNTSPFAGCDVITSIIPAGAVVPMHTNPVNADTKYLYG